MTRRMPKGFHESGKVKVAVYFDPPLFDKIVDMAIAEDKPFSAMVNELCQVGIFDLEEAA